MPTEKDIKDNFFKRIWSKLPTVRYMISFSLLVIPTIVFNIYGFYSNGLFAFAYLTVIDLIVIMWVILIRGWEHSLIRVQNLQKILTGLEMTSEENVEER